MATDNQEPFSNAAALVELERGMKTFRSFEHAHKVISVLNDHDKILANLRQQIQAAENDYRSRMDKYQRELDGAAADVERWKADAANAADYDRKVGEELIASARKEAEGIIGYAKRKLSAAESSAAEADNRRLAYEQTVADRRTELAELNAQIKQAKEQIAKILGSA